MQEFKPGDIAVVIPGTISSVHKPGDIFIVADVDGESCQDSNKIWLRSKNLVKIYTCPPQPEQFKVGEVIAVRDSNTQDWRYSRFESYDSDHTYRAGLRFKTTHNWWRYARKLTPEERGEE